MVNTAREIYCRMAGNVGGMIFWKIAETMSFGGIYFGGLSHTNIHSKMANRTRWDLTGL